MAVLKSAIVALLTLHTIGSFAAKEQAKPIVEPEYEIPDAPAGAEQPITPSLDIKVAVDFPNSDFGVKLVNGHATSAHISLVNAEAEPVTVRMIGGSLWNLAADKAPDTSAVALRNLTAQNYNLEIPAGKNQTLTYTFATELHPQDLTLLLAAIIHAKNAVFQIEAFNGTVAVVEAPISFFDPQILFLYAFLLTCFAGTCFFIYSTWIKPLFPQQKHRRPGVSSRKSQPSAASPGDVPAEATTTGAYDASWIPAQHLQRPEAKRVGSGKVKSRAK